MSDRCECITDDGVQMPGMNPDCPVCGWEEHDKWQQISMDEIVSLLDICGIKAEIVQTGGGTATLFAGEQDADGRYQAVAGPGLFRDYRNGQYRDAWAWRGEFYVSRDDDGATLPIDCEQLTSEQIAKAIRDLVRG